MFKFELRPLTGAIAILAGTAAPSACAQQSCDAILNKALLDDRQVVNEGARSQANSFNSCRSGSDSSAGGGDLDIVGVASGSGSGSRSSSSQGCDSVEANDAASYFEYEAQRGLNASVVAAWKDCKLERENLQCWASPTSDKEEVEIFVSWKNGAISLPRIESTTFRNASYSGDVESELAEGNSLLYGFKSFVVTRLDDARPLRMTLNATLDERISYSCTVAVPPHMDEEDLRRAEFNRQCNALVAQTRQLEEKLNNLHPFAVSCSQDFALRDSGPIPIPPCAMQQSNDAYQQIMSAVSVRTEIRNVGKRASQISTDPEMQCDVPSG